MAKSFRKLGPYTLVKQIGLGGFGVVWLAEKRTSIATTQFALKLPRGEDVDLEAFRQEAAIWIQASGHPNVLPLIEAEVYDDQVVIVSEYVPDGSLAGWLKQHGGKAPSAEAAVEIMDGVLAGLAHLHTRRIIHRDLKPENILLQRETPRLADFGIARLLKSSSHSAHISGTLAYMAPEAFDGQRNEQTDVWSIGVIFYEMLAGRLPYDQPDIPSFIGAIMRHDPPPLPIAVPEVLRTIVSKALQRDPANRYATVMEMRRELREAEHRLWLGGRETVLEPERTKPAPAHEMPVQQPVDPQPTMLMPAAITKPFILPVKPTLPGDTWSQPLRAKKQSQRRRWLWLAASVVMLIGIQSYAGYYLWFNWHDLSKQTLTGHTTYVLSLAFSPDGKTIASGGARDSPTTTLMELWDAGTGRSRKGWNGHTGVVYSVAFSPDSKILASADDDAIKLWDAQTGSLQRTFDTQGEYVTSIAFSPDGMTIASGDNDATVGLWDVQTGKRKQILNGHSEVVRSVAFSPDGKTLVSGSSDKTIKLWDVQSGALRRTLTGHTFLVFSVAFSPDGTILASGSGDGTIRLWETQTGTLKLTMNIESGTINSVAFSPDGKTIATGNSNRTITLWNSQTGRLTKTLTGHHGAVNAVSFSPDGKTLASGSDDYTVKLWRVD